MNTTASTQSEPMVAAQSISRFMEKHFRHFNARETLAAAQAYKQHIDSGGKMLLAMAGAMSTGELGVSLARMIREDKIHAISCTAANLEEDVFNLVAHSEYRICEDWRALSADDETALRDQGFNRVTDTCIPETVMRHVEEPFIGICDEVARGGDSLFPYQVFYRMFERGILDEHFDISPDDSWLYAAWKKGIPVYSPGFEDSTLGNIFAARAMEGRVASHHAIRTGTEQMQHLIEWYLANDAQAPIGFFQIGGGIAGDFAICSVPCIIQDLQRDVRFWQYFAQISDSTTSYGSYSGAVPNEKITWFKLDKDAPKFMINSDASIVAPLIFAFVLGD